MEFVVDVQGFKKPINQFVFKELALVPLQEDAQPTVYLFEPPNYWDTLPAKYKSENLWLTRNYHGIEWTSGGIPYDEVRIIIREKLRNARAVYVKGLEKKKWFEQYLTNVCNLEDLGCPPLKKLYNTVSISCDNHPQIWNYQCAVRNALALKTWFLSPQDQPTIRQYNGSKDDDDDDDDDDGNDDDDATIKKGRDTPDTGFSNTTKSIDSSDTIMSNTTLKDFYNRCEFMF